MKKILFPLAIPMSMLFLLMACNDPTVIGAELLEQDEADVRFTDTLTLQTQTITEDSVVTYTVDNQFNSFACGYFQDPVFGTVRSEIYSQFKEASLDAPAFENPVLDSLVLTLGIDTNKVYGTFNENYRLEIHRITEDLAASGETIYSDRTFMTETDILGAIDFTPDPSNLQPYATVFGLDTIDGSFISIRLDDQLGEDMLNDDWYEVDEFVTRLRGLQIRLANSMPTEGLLNFNMNSTFTRLRLYYRNITSDLDTIPEVYDFGVSGSTTPRHANMTHDFTGAPIEPYFNNLAGGDTLLFIQGMSGPNVAIDVPYLQDLGNIIVNKAELEFYVAELPEDNPDLYTPSTQLVVTFQEDGQGEEYFLADDVVLNPSAFGGILQEEEINGATLQKYTMNVASYLNRRILEGNVGTFRIFLRAFPKQETTNRVTLYGPSHAQYPAKLKLTYTNISN